MSMRSRSEAAVISREPSLPSATTATRPPPMTPCSAVKRLNHALEQRCDQTLRQRAIGAPGPVGVEAARQQVEADMKHLLRSEIARPVQGLLEGLRLRHKRLDPGGHGLVVETRRRSRGCATDRSPRRARAAASRSPARGAGRCPAHRRTIHAQRRSSAGSTEARPWRASAPALRRRRKARRRGRPIRRRLRAAPGLARSAPHARAACGPLRGGRSASRERSPRRTSGRWKPSDCKVASVAGSSVTPVKTRSPDATLSSGASSNSRA